MACALVPLRIVDIGPAEDHLTNRGKRAPRSGSAVWRVGRRAWLPTEVVGPRVAKPVSDCSIRLGMAMG